MDVRAQVGSPRQAHPARRVSLSGLPPLLIQVGTGDILRGESQKVADRARDNGVEAQLELYPIDAHIFHHFLVIRARGSRRARCRRSLQRLAPSSTPRLGYDIEA